MREQAVKSGELSPPSALSMKNPDPVESGSDTSGSSPHNASDELLLLNQRLRRRKNDRTPGIDTVPGGRAHNDRTSGIDTVPGGWAIPLQSRDHQAGSVNNFTSLYSVCSTASNMSSKSAISASAHAPLGGREVNSSSGPPSYGSNENGLRIKPAEHIPYAPRASAGRLRALRLSEPSLASLGSGAKLVGRPGQVRTSRSHIADGSESSPPRPSKRRALVIGISYSRARGATTLKSAAKSTSVVLELLCDTLGLVPANIWLLVDEPVERMEGCRQFQPSKANIVNAMKWLVNGSLPGDSLLFYFTGMGGQKQDKNGDELGGWDDTILPVDFREEGHILDDYIHQLLVGRLPHQVQLTAIIDAENTATVMDLPFLICSKGTELGQIIGNEYESKLRHQLAKAEVDGDKSSTEQRIKKSRSKKHISSLLNPRSARKHKKELEDSRILLEHADGLQKRRADEIKHNGQVLCYTYVADGTKRRNTLLSAAKSGDSLTGGLTKSFVRAVQSSNVGSQPCTYFTIFEAMQANLPSGSTAHIVPQLTYSHAEAPNSAFFSIAVKK